MDTLIYTAANLLRIPQLQGYSDIQSCRSAISSPSCSHSLSFLLSLTLTRNLITDLTLQGVNMLTGHPAPSRYLRSKDNISLPNPLSLSSTLPPPPPASTTPFSPTTPPPTHTRHYLLTSCCVFVLTFKAEGTFARHLHCQRRPVSRDDLTEVSSREVLSGAGDGDHHCPAQLVIMTVAWPHAAVRQATRI